MKNLLLAFFIYAFSVSCKNSSNANNLAVPPEYDTTPANHFVIKGKVTDMDTGWVFFFYEDTLNPGRNFSIHQRKDSAGIKKGEFSLSGNVKGTTKALVGVKLDNKTIQAGPVIFIDPGITYIEMAGKTMHANFKATGTPPQDLYTKFCTESQPLINDGNAIYVARLGNKKSVSQKISDSLDVAEEIYRKKYDSVVFHFVKNNPASVVAAYVASRYFTESAPKINASEVYELLADTAKNTVYGKLLAERSLAINRTSIGASAPAFILPDKNKKQIALGSLLTEYTLVDFWASWCGPCRAENPYLLNAYNQYKNKGFSIVSVSLDNNKTAWIKAMTEDKLPWQQLSDLKGTESPVKKLYGITTIPRNFLLDKQGNIIALDLRGEKLEKKLKELIP